MIERFIKKFSSIGSGFSEKDKHLYSKLPKQLFELLDSQGGKSFANGLYRVHGFSSSIRWSLIIGQYFSKYESKLFPFGFDWMGRQFCMSTVRSGVLFMLDPATGEDFELEQDIDRLHDDDFVDDTDDMLAIELFKKVMKYHNLKEIGYNECLGYKVPLFLGGKDSIENYELSDIEVYWGIVSQLFKKVQDLPDGTNIKSIKFD
jgi:hypothetical protein